MTLAMRLMLGDDAVLVLGAGRPVCVLSGSAFCRGPCFVGVPVLSKGP